MEGSGIPPRGLFKKKKVLQGWASQNTGNSVPKREMEKETLAS